MAPVRTKRSASMKLQLAINGAADEIELLSPPPACRFQLRGSPERSALVEKPEPGVYSLLLEGVSYEAYVEETAEGLVVSITGNDFAIQVDDPRRWSRKPAGCGGE